MCPNTDPQTADGSTRKIQFLDLRLEATLTKAVAELRLRTERHEQQLAQAPSGQQFADVRVQLAALEGRQEAVFNEAHGARAAIRRVEDFLLKAGRHETQY